MLRCIRCTDGVFFSDVQLWISMSNDGFGISLHLGAGFSVVLDGFVFIGLIFGEVARSGLKMSAQFLGERTTGIATRPVGRLADFAADVLVVTGDVGFVERDGVMVLSLGLGAICDPTRHRSRPRYDGAGGIDCL